MPLNRNGARPDFGAAFTSLLDAAGLTPDRLLAHLRDCRGHVSRSTLYDWKKGEHLPEDTRALLEVVQVCLAAARQRGTSPGPFPADAGGWLRLLAAAKQGRDSRVTQSRGGRGRPGPRVPGPPIGRWDPLALGVHRAIGGGPLPPYIRRDHDSLLWAVLDPEPAANRLVVLRGGSSTGKSRAAYEAVIGRLPLWHLDFPRTPAALARRLEEGIVPRTVLWLGELRHYAEADGAATPLGDLAELVGEDGRVVVITTLWPEHWAAYTVYDHDGASAAGSTAATRALLTPLPELLDFPAAGLDASRGGVIDVPHYFTRDDLARAEDQHDRALSEAIAAARAAGRDGEIAQHLAGVPDLLNHYSGPGADVYGRAVITAAMDAARLGRNGPYSPELLQEAAIGYLTDQQRTADPADWWATAIKYAIKELKGTVRALRPIPPRRGTGIAGYKIADYLDQYGQRTRRNYACPDLRGVR